MDEFKIYGFVIYPKIPTIAYLYLGRGVYLMIMERSFVAEERYLLRYLWACELEQAVDQLQRFSECDEYEPLHEIHNKLFINPPNADNLPCFGILCLNNYNNKKY